MTNHLPRDVIFDLVRESIAIACRLAATAPAECRDSIEREATLLLTMQQAFPREDAEHLEVLQNRIVDHRGRFMFVRACMDLLCIYPDRQREITSAINRFLRRPIQISQHEVIASGDAADRAYSELQAICKK